MVRIPTHRPPTHPGEMLLKEYLNPMELTQRDLAEAIHVSYQCVNELVNQKRGVIGQSHVKKAEIMVSQTPEEANHAQPTIK